ncbi:unnamed protein product [Mycena citricolor]|uniref:EF-hand domain-containing protein n=1 Tax=Mycena citricolor TaxID=2018698 RepID=A0AAD2H6C4_9AGAR|nr:unnamed protein product [Mycena citricolor]
MSTGTLPKRAVLNPQNHTSASIRAEDSDSEWIPVNREPPKRSHSPLSYLRIRKKSSSSDSVTKNAKEDKTTKALRKTSSTESFVVYRPHPAPPVPPLPHGPTTISHSRGFSEVDTGQRQPRQMASRSRMNSENDAAAAGSSAISVIPQNESSAAHPIASQQHGRPPIAYSPDVLWPRPPQSDDDRTRDFLLNTQSFLPQPSAFFAADVLAAAASDSSSSFVLSKDALGPDPPPPGKQPHIRNPPSTQIHHHHLADGLVTALESDKEKIAAKLEPLITVGMQNMSKAQTAVDEMMATEAWSVVKENAETVLAPAKDAIMIMDSVVKYVPVLTVAESLFSVIVHHELEKKENDKNILVVYHTMSLLWFTLCDVQRLFRAHYAKSDLEQFFQDLERTIREFGNFREVYYRHARAVRSAQYRSKLTNFTSSFKEYKGRLDSILLQTAAMQVNDMSADVRGVSSRLDEMNRKLDSFVRLLGRQTGEEREMQKKIRAAGGEKVLEDPAFLLRLAQGKELPSHVSETLRTTLDEALKSNLPAFTMKIDIAVKEMTEAVERSTEKILNQARQNRFRPSHSLVNSGMNWRMSCKARNFVDAVHNYFGQKFGDHRQRLGKAHPDQWTLDILNQVIYYSNISDAIDDDGNGYISVQEVNRFFKARPDEFSAPQWLAFWAVGWNQNALEYKSRCVTLFAEIEATARRVHTHNRAPVKAYIKNSGISELWLLVESLQPHSVARSRQESHLSLERLRADMMEKETKLIAGQLGSKAKHILCLIDLVLTQHLRVLTAAHTLVLSEREFEMMATALTSIVAAVSHRYQTLIQTWKQQRLDTEFLVRCFAGGVFGEWNAVFRDQPVIRSDDSSSPEISKSGFPTTRAGPMSLDEVLVFPLPEQPFASPENRIETPPRGFTMPHHNAKRGSHYFDQFGFQEVAADKRASILEPISQVHVNSKKLKLEDRMANLEGELAEIKSMIGILVNLHQGSAPST